MKPRYNGGATSQGGNDGGGGGGGATQQDDDTRTSTAAIVVDDPCWGDPDHCSLDYLLTFLDRNHCILQESPRGDYIMMNKPADLRMDGEYPATIHKLITYWYPPPTLLKNHGNNSNLLQYITTNLHRHSDTPDKEVQVRPCHQLDYATSGVLLLARNTAAAAYASTCFEQRRVQKTYLAVLHGHLVASNKEWPVLPASRVTIFLEQQEDQYKRLQHKKRRQAKANTFNGFQPPNAFFQIWQGRYARNVLKTGKRKREKLNEEQWDQVDQALGLTDDECGQMSGLSWKQLKTKTKFKDAIKRATERYNQFLKKIIDDKEQQQQQQRAQEEEDNNPLTTELPTLFRVEGDDPNVFYIYLALAQVEDDFAMRILNDSTTAAAATLATGDPSRLNFKVALTQCRILNNDNDNDSNSSRATTLLNGRPVTKVELRPRTGRRHQLRVHTTFIGHPIVGDQTYETLEQKRANLSPRMCLHAHRLQFPLPKPTTKPTSTTTKAKQETKKNDTRDNSHNKEQVEKEEEKEKAADTEEGADDQQEEENMLRATAPDPFVVSEEGRLTIAPM